MADRSESPELERLIDRRPMSSAQWLVVLFCAAALFVDGYDIQVMALTVPTLAGEWSLPESRFGLALSAVVIGITIGSGCLGPLGDRFGRKTLLVASMLATGIATACTALASTPTEFVLWRFVTGLTLGAGLPNCAALTSEYAPLARRSMFVGLINLASPLGAFSAGFVAPPVLAAFGWPGTFVVGGAAPILVGVLIWLLVPESLKFLLVRRPDDPRIATIIGRIAPSVDPRTVLVAADRRPPRASLLLLLGPRFRARTLLLWTMLCLNLFNLYVLVSWLPTLLQRSGWDMAAALQGAVLIQGGGVLGGIAMTAFLDRGAARSTLAVGFTLAAGSLLAFGFVPSGAGWGLLLLLLGAGVSGSQLSLNALSAAYYPPEIKATGLSGGLLIGGLGSILGPLAGAALLDLGLTPVAILALLAIPPLLCIVGAGFMRREWQAH
jgi:AAHS family 4-hydroxybenzoate transporter-like MFS transporter